MLSYGLIGHDGAVADFSIDHDLEVSDLQAALFLRWRKKTTRKILRKEVVVAGWLWD
jgi:hypothetical protein